MLTILVNQLLATLLGLVKLNQNSVEVLMKIYTLRSLHLTDIDYSSFTYYEKKCYMASPDVKNMENRKESIHIEYRAYFIHKHNFTRTNHK